LWITRENVFSLFKKEKPIFVDFTGFLPSGVFLIFSLLKALDFVF